LAVSTALAELAEGQRPERHRIGVFLTNTRAGWSYGEPELGLLVHQGPEAMHAYQATAWFPAAAQGESTIALDLRRCSQTAAGGHAGSARALGRPRGAGGGAPRARGGGGAGAARANGLVWPDGPGAEPLPPRGPAEGAIVFVLRRPTGSAAIRLRDLLHT